MPRPSYANVTSTLALVVALGGTAVAAGPLVTGKDVRNGSLTGLDVKDRSLTAKDLRGSVRGPSGPPGAPGAPGAPGTDAAASVRTLIPVADVPGSQVSSYVVTEVGTFTKQSGTTRVDLRFATDVDPEVGCRLQLRVDGAASSGETGLDSATVTTPGDVSIFGPDTVPAIVLASFADLDPGVHTVSVAAAVPLGATSCNVNASGIAREVVVDEVAVA